MIVVRRPAPARVSALQFIAACAALGYITEAEAESWAAGNALPAAVLAMIASLPQQEQFPARLRALAMTEAERDSPMIAAALSVLGLSEAARDDLFRMAATL